MQDPVLQELAVGSMKYVRDKTVDDLALAAATVNLKQIYYSLNNIINYFIYYLERENKKLSDNSMSISKVLQQERMFDSSVTKIP